MTTTPRGPLSARAGRLAAQQAGAPVLHSVGAADIWSDDAQLALWTAYDVHYSDDSGHAVGAQWDPELLELGRTLGQQLETELRTAFDSYVPRLPRPGSDPGTALLTFVDRLDGDVGDGILGGRSLSRFVQREATREQVVALLAERSLFGLRESDPHAFVLPRLRGAAKTALAELLYDEFGAGRPEALHATLYAEAMSAAGLDPTPGTYVDRASVGTLAVNNTMSLLCLNVRLAPAAVGHFAAFEATSSVPSRRMARGIERVGLPPATAAYFHEHVLADSVHDQVAAHDLCGSLVTDRPETWDEVLFGVFCNTYVEARAARDQLDRWERDSAAPAELEVSA